MLAASRTWSSGWEVSIHAVQGVITSTLMCFGFALYRCYFCYTIFLGVLSTYIVEKFRKPDIGLDLWFGFWISVQGQKKIASLIFYSEKHLTYKNCSDISQRSANLLDTFFQSFQTEKPDTIVQTQPKRKVSSENIKRLCPPIYIYTYNSYNTLATLYTKNGFSTYWHRWL